MCDAFQGVRDGVREIVHRVNGPIFPGCVVFCMGNAVQHWVAEIHIRVDQVNAREEPLHLRPSRQLACEQIGLGSPESTRRDLGLLFRPAQSLRALGALFPGQSHPHTRVLSIR
jgi:hypothetical protein